MKSLKTILLILVCFFSATVFAQQGVNVDNKGASAKSKSGGGAVVNSKGSEIKNSKGGGVEAHKNQVAAKSSSGKGVEANKKGVQVKGSKGGMTINKKKLEIKSKNVNIKLGDKK
ncbi:MAG: hypothetical protein V4615_13130 [Bacteroidota bacterium]